MHTILHTLMKKAGIAYLLALFTMAVSCKAIKNLTAKDNSATPKTAKKEETPADRTFLESFSVVPGGARTSVAENGKAKVYTPTLNKPKTSFNIETASSLQFKYATIMDVPVEDLYNINLLKEIEYWWGTKYCMGGSTENCIDCSAFTQNVLSDVYHINLPRTAQQQYDSCMHIDPTALQQGDLVFFQTSRRDISHVGVYMGNNKFVHASVSNGVIISDLNEAYWRPKFRGAGRVIK